MMMESEPNLVKRGGCDALHVGDDGRSGRRPQRQ
jgi:hypothetical protein